MLEVFGAIFLALIIIGIVLTGSGVLLVAVVAGALLLLVIGVLLFGTAVTLAIKLAVAVLLAAVLQFIFARVLAAIGARANVPALVDQASCSRIAWIASGIVTGYIYFMD